MKTQLRLTCLGVAIGFASPALAEPLVPTLYYDFEEGSGEILTNKGSLGDSANGILNGSTFTVDGDERFVASPAGLASSTPGTALRLDGTTRASGGDWIDTQTTLRNVPIGTGGTPYDRGYTASVWVNVEVFGNNTVPPHASGDGIIFGADKPTGEQWLHIGTRNNQFHLGHYGSDQTSATTGGYSTNTWYHVAYVSDGATHRIFVNGVQVSSGGGKRYVLESGLDFNLIIGNTSAEGTNRGFTGMIDDVAVFDRALDGARIAQLAAGTSPLDLAPLEEDPGPVSAGIEGSAGLFGITEQIGAGPVADLATVRSNLEAGGGTIINHSKPVINFQDSGTAGLFTGDLDFGVVEAGEVAKGAVENLSMVARGVIRISAEQAGFRTFVVNSDDGFDLTVRELATNNVVPFTAGAGDAGTFVTDWGSLRFPDGRGTDYSFGHINLPEGDYKLELLYWEGTSGSAVELFAGPGRVSGIGNLTSAFALVGQTVGVPAREEPMDVNHSTGTPGPGFETVMIYDAFASQPNNIDNAVAAIESYWAGGDHGFLNVVTEDAAVINFDDPQSGIVGYGTPQNPFPGSDDGVNNDNFAFGARGTLTVTEEGYYTFLIFNDDQTEFTLEGTSGWVVTGNSSLVDRGDGYQGFRANGANSNAFGKVLLTPGDYNLKVITREGGGGSGVELWTTYMGNDQAAADGRIFGYNAAAFKLLGEAGEDGTFQQLHVGQELVSGGVSTEADPRLVNLVKDGNNVTVQLSGGLANTMYDLRSSTDLVSFSTIEDSRMTDGSGNATFSFTTTEPRLFVVAEEQ